MNDDHTIRCPACLAEYSRNDAPAEYLRVLHILDPRSISDPKLAHAAHLARLSAEVLAKDKLPAMSQEEQDELMANINSAGTTNWPPMMEFKDLTPEDQKSVKDYIAINFYKPSILEQVCVGLNELGVCCTFGVLRIIVPIVDGGSWRFGYGSKTWEGQYIAIDIRLDFWLSDVPNECTDVPRIVKSIFTWIKRFDYREYRGPTK